MLLSEHVYCVVVAFKMTEWVEQWAWIKFCIKLEQSSADTLLMIQKTFGDDAVSAAQITVWHKHFKDSQESVENDPCSERPASSRTPGNVERVWTTDNKDHQLIVRELEADLGNSENYCVWEFDSGSWHKTCPGKIRSVASATRAEGKLCYSC